VEGRRNFDAFIPASPAARFSSTQVATGLLNSPRSALGQELPYKWGFVSTVQGTKQSVRGPGREAAGMARPSRREIIHQGREWCVCCVCCCMYMMVCSSRSGTWNQSGLGCCVSSKPNEIFFLSVECASSDGCGRVLQSDRGGRGAAPSHMHICTITGSDSHSIVRSPKFFQKATHSTYGTSICVCFY